MSNVFRSVAGTLRSVARVLRCTAGGFLSAAGELGRVAGERSAAAGVRGRSSGIFGAIGYDSGMSPQAVFIALRERMLGRAIADKRLFLRTLQLYLEPEPGVELGRAERDDRRG